MSPIILAVLAAAAVSAAAILLFVAGRFRRQNDDLTRQFRDMRESMERFVQSENERRIHEQTKSIAVLENNKQSIENQVGALNKELGRIVGLIQDIEKGRIHQHASLEEKIAQAVTSNSALSDVTQKLSSVLGNNQLRGEWGARLAEDILRHASLEEGVHYFREKAQDTVSTRPDFTLSLPGNHKVYLDVKFPLANYKQMLEAVDKREQERYANEFKKDVGKRIRELTKREYINPEEQTLDYVILFIPNEQIFGYMHRQFPDVMDDALSQKILMASPYSLYGVLSVIRQAFDNFHLKKSTDEILKLLEAFNDDYRKFKERFGEVGLVIEKLKGKYAEVSETSFKRLDGKIRKLENFRKGKEAGFFEDEEEKKEFLLQ